MVSVEYSKAMVEILDILDNSEDEIKNKIPKKLLDFWEKNKSLTYKPKLDHSKPLNEMELMDKTKSIIAMIYVNYLCTDSEKGQIKEIIQENEQKYQEELRKKYNPDDIFKNKKIEENIQDKNDNYNTNNSMTKYKQSLFQKLVNKFKHIFKQ